MRALTRSVRSLAWHLQDPRYATFSACMLGLFCPLTLFWASRKIGEESTGYDGLNMAVMQIISVFLAIAAVPLAIAALYIMAHLSAIQSTFSTNRLFWTVTLVYFAVASFVGVVAHHNLSEE